MKGGLCYGLVWWLVLLPTALTSPLLLGLVALGRGGLPLGTLLILGSLGLLTLSRLDSHFRLGTPLGHPAGLLAGLLAGVIASLGLCWLIPGAWLSLWPLLAAAYFLLRLWRR